ncbi:MAG: hypothetical protein HY906_17225 [Deltaproteobacteria bacterium]|nr:hypothetical protein [Deltaproteobacteria bacterium]
MAESDDDTGHDVHFLSRLSRVSVQQTELALRRCPGARHRALDALGGDR